MTRQQKIKLLQKSITSDLQKVDRLLISTAREEDVCFDDLLRLTKLLYDTRRKVDGLITKYEKRMCS